MKISYHGGEITSDEMVRFLALNGRAEAIATEIIMHREVVNKARELKVEAAAEDLQQFADLFRSLRSLFAAEDMRKFLEHAGLTEDDFETFCESSLLVTLVRERLADDRAIENYFVNNRSQFDYARASLIVVGDENLANEIAIQVTEEGADFHALARRHSIDEATKYAGGYRGLLTREMFPPEVGTKVFSASPGELLGPYRHEGTFQLLWIEEIWRASLNKEVKEAIKDCIFREWVASFVKEGISIVR